MRFRPLTRDDLPQLRDWLNAPHVYRWWGAASGPGSLGGAGADAATLADVEAKYGPNLVAADLPTHRHLILEHGAAIGLIQHWRLSAFPRFAAAIGETRDGTYGLDYFIGDPSRVGRGVGSTAIDAYVGSVVVAAPMARRAVAGPHPDNVASCRALEKAGFVAVRDVLVPDEGPQRIYARDLVTTARPSGVSR